MNPRTIISAALTILIGLASSLAAAEGGPQGVSPGATGRLAHIKNGCPTFTWEESPETKMYELVVHRIDPVAIGSSPLELTSDNEVLYTSISGRATAWTPESDDCFLAGESYVWFIRAVSDTETGEGSGWSEPRFFEVAFAPTAEELERAIEVLRRWEAANGGPSSAPSSAAVSVAATDTASAPVPDSGAGSTHPKSVITGTAAIRGEQPDFSGETYGVVGLNASPDGAGIGAANIAGGPDLVLHGTVPAELSEVGIDRPSASAQTFSFSNTGGGGMILDIEGAGVLTTASDLDADTLDGMDSAEFVTDPEAAALFAVHATSTDHDGRYYTETELSTSGAGGSVHWDNLAAVPAGFADGIDNDTSYSFGQGIMLDDGQIVINPAAFHTRISTLEGTDFVGEWNSVAIGDDGLGLISYYDRSNGDLKVAHCNDVMCTGATTYTLDSTGDVGPNTSIAIGADGLGLISYVDMTNVDLKVAHCDDTVCSTASIVTVDSADDVGWYGTSLTIGDDDLGLISYFDATNNNLKVAHCDNVLCTGSTISTLSVGGLHSSIAIGSDGFGLITSFNGSNLKADHCSNTLCTSSTSSTVDNTSTYIGRFSSVAIGTDGLGIISYFDKTNQDLKVAHCDDIACTGALLRTLDDIDNLDDWFDTSIAIGTDGLPIISYHHGRHSLKVAHCSDVRCINVMITHVDGPSTLGAFNSIAIGADGLPLISYFDDANNDLKVAHLPYGY